MQSVPITKNIASSNPAQGRCRQQILTHFGGRQQLLTHFGGRHQLLTHFGARQQLLTHFGGRQQLLTHSFSLVFSKIMKVNCKQVYHQNE
jgi:hypothetical protein